MHHWCSLLGRCRIPSCTCMIFFLPRESISSWLFFCEWVYSWLSDLNFLRNDRMTWTVVVHQMQTIQKIQQSFSDDTMDITQIKEWYNWSHIDGKQLTFWYPSTSSNDKVIDQMWTLVMQDHCIIAQKLADKLGISTVLCEDLNLIDR